MFSNHNQSLSLKYLKGVYILKQTHKEKVTDSEQNNRLPNLVIFFLRQAKYTIY